MDQLDTKVITRFQQVVDTILFLNKRKAFEFKGKSFYPSEVHLMLAVKGLRNTNVTRIAEAMGVTKGAISQTISRLVTKEVLYKTKDRGNKNELALHFTPFGEDALADYEAVLEDMRLAHQAILAPCSAREKEAIATYLTNVQELFSKLE